jgi:AraC family transcriptional regulator
MGAYGFPDVPRFARVISDQGWAAMQRLLGHDQGWDVPACLWHAPEGFDAPIRNLAPHHTISFNLPGTSTSVESLRPGGRGLLRAGERSVGLQVAGAPDHYRARGPLRFAHLYVTEAMLRRCGAELFAGPGDRAGLLPGAAPFTADAELYAMALAYVTRAADMAEPPGALEMDSRAALLGLWLVRRHSVLAIRPPRAAARGGLAPWQLRRVTGHMQAHLDRDVTLAELSVLVGLSPYHFCRAFAPAPACRRIAGWWSVGSSARRS